MTSLRRLGSVVSGPVGALSRWPQALLAAALALTTFGIARAAEPTPAPATASTIASAPSAGCPPPPTALSTTLFQDGLRDAKDHGFLWRITKDGRTSYLYGTIHAARLDWMFPGPSVLDAIRASDTVALELDVLDPSLQKRLMASIGPRRDEPLPAALQRRIDRRLAAECLDAAVWSTFAPEFQVASLTVMVGRREGLDPAYAIDLVLAILARDLDKPVASLETPESQAQALRMPTRAETIAFVTSSLDDLDADRARPLLDHLAKVWTEGDYAGISNYAAWCDCMRTPADRAAMKRLLDDRNPALADGIDALHASGKSVFAAVGTLHMIGPNGLPALMARRGYKVEQGEFEETK